MSNAIQIAAKLYEARDAMKSLYGDRFREKVAGWRPIIQAAMRKHGVDEVGAILKLNEALGGRAGGITTLIIMAVAVEMVEPSEVAE